MNEKMEKALKEALFDGEQVLWESGTQQFRLLDGKEGRKTLIQWVLSTVFCAGFTILRVSQGAVSIKFFLIILAVYALLMLAPVVSYRQLLGLRCYLTGGRAIQIKKDGSVYSMKLDGAPAKLFPIGPGAAIAIGSAVIEEGDKQLRWRALHALENAGKFDGCNASGLVFYNVERAEAAMQLLQAHAPSAGTEAR